MARASSLALKQSIPGIVVDVANRAASLDSPGDERRLRSLLENASDVVAILARDGTISYVSPSVSRIGGYQVDEVVGKNLLGFVHPEDAALALEELTAVIRNPDLQRTSQLRFRHNNGAWLVLESIARNALDDPILGGIVINARDISDRKAAELALAESEGRYRKLVQVSPEAIFISAEGRIEFVNDAAARLFGARNAAEMPGRKVLDHIHPDSRPIVEQRLQAFRDGAKTQPRMEQTYLRLDGTPVAVEVASVRFRHAGRRAVLSVARDINERKRAEQLLRLEHALTRCLADADDASTGLQAAIRLICESQGWEAARYFRADDPAGLLRFSEAWSAPHRAHAPFLAASQQLSFVPGVGIAGRVWRSGEPIWVPDVRNDDRVLNKALANESDVRSAFVFPVTSQGRPIGVLATFSRAERAPDELLLQSVHVIGSQLGQFLKRKQAEERLVLQAQRQQRVAQFGQFALGETDPGKLFNEALRAACSGIADMAALLELSRTGEYVVRAACGEDLEATVGKGHRLSADSVLPRLLEHPGPHVAGRDYLQSRSVQFAWLQRMGSAIYAPVRGDPAFGILAVYSTSDGAFGNDDVRHVEAISSILSTALQRQMAEQRLARLAQFDPVSGLPNRTLFRDRLDQALAHAGRNQRQVGLLFVDLDQFKWVNDTLGHAAGDALLRNVGERLQACLRSGDTVARLGGDEFAVLLPDLESPEAAGVVAEKMLEALKAQFQIAGNEVFIGASIGVTVYPPDAIDAETLLSNADIAMYRAKDAGRNNYQFFSPDMNADAAHRLALEKDLRHALERGEFELHYQPKADVTCTTVTGAEALLRWRRGDGTLVSPAEFIPVLEDTGLIAPVGDWVILEACRQIVRWNGSLRHHLSIAVNVSARQFRGGQLLASVKKALAETGCAPECLEIEVTESMVMHDVDVTIETLHALRALGVRVAVDDFGTGYSSLAYLKKLPIDVLKIDRTFVKDLSEDPNDAAIATAIIAMARTLGYRVVAEGVETQMQRQFLEAYGCDQIQGYLLSRPLPHSQFAEWLTKRGSGI